METNPRWYTDYFESCFGSSCQFFCYMSTVAELRNNMLIEKYFKRLAPQIPCLYAAAEGAPVSMLY